MIAIALYVPESRDHSAPRPDVIGGLLAVAGLLSLVFAAIEAPDRGWGDGIVRI
jgi:hypothetical protein